MRHFAGQLLANFFFSLFLVIIPEVFAKVNSAQFPSRIFDQSRKETFVWLASVQSPYRAQMSKQRWLLSETLLWQDRHLWLLLCVYKKSFIDRKIAVSDLKHACLSSPWVSCHVNVLYLAHRRPVAGWSSFEVRVINLSRSKLRVLRKVRKRKKVELFAPAQTKVSCLTNHNRQTNQWTGETSKWKCEANCLGGKARVEYSFCLWFACDFACDWFKDLEILNHKQWYYFHDNGGAFLSLLSVVVFTGVLSSSRPWTLCQRGYGYKVLRYQP